MALTHAASAGLTATGCSLHTLPVSTDPRGSLAVAQTDAVLAAEAKRVFLVFDVPADAHRGGHANRRAAEVLIAATGSVSVIVDNGHIEHRVLLDRPTLALRIPPMVWTMQQDFHPGTALVVIASHDYDPDDYIGDYAEFRRNAHASH
ncbi:MAG: WxcM-like domain-containing protein [Actinobacteria bacterium]|uniref:Unannotated protein n=1 Tax=freshwater metagenome TaxID=449393 RepID=A0A6J7IXU4_9ZZZZ|nr:WxcM-like domain-containing protein [Actinomycetota bacterium]